MVLYETRKEPHPAQRGTHNSNMSIQDDTRETESTEEQTGSRASEDLLEGNPRFNIEADTDGLNPRIRRDPDPESEETSAEASGYDEVAKDLSEEAEEVAKSTSAGEEQTLEETLAEWDPFSETEEVRKSNSMADVLDIAFDEGDFEEIKREHNGLAKSDEEKRLQELESRIEDLPAEFAKVLLAVMDMAEEDGEDQSAAEILTEVKSRSEEALDELDELEALISEGHEDGSDETAKGEDAGDAVAEIEEEIGKPWEEMSAAEFREHLSIPSR